MPNLPDRELGAGRIEFHYEEDEVSYVPAHTLEIVDQAWPHAPSNEQIGFSCQPINLVQHFLL